MILWYSRVEMCLDAGFECKAVVYGTTKVLEKLLEFIDVSMSN